MKYPLITAILLGISVTAFAGKDEHEPPPPPEPETPPAAVSESSASSDASAGAISGSAAGAHAGATGGESEAASKSDATGGAADATGGDSTGASSTTSYNSSFFALSRSQPGASGCWGGADGGGANGSGGGFLGIHLLNKDCWSSYIAELERSIKIKARLNCGGKVYRNSVAFEFKRRDRQRECVRIVTAEYQKQIDHDNAVAENVLLLEEIDRLEKQLLETSTDRDTTITKLTACRLGNQRATDAYLGCLKK